MKALRAGLGGMLQDVRNLTNATRRGVEEKGVRGVLHKMVSYGDECNDSNDRF